MANNEFLPAKCDLRVDLSQFPREPIATLPADALCEKAQARMPRGRPFRQRATSVRLSRRPAGPQRRRQSPCEQRNSFRNEAFGLSEGKGILIVPLPSHNPRRELERPTILVVEDEVLLRCVICEELRAHGFQTIEAVNADEALAVMSSSAPIALVMTDIMMPGAMDGLALAEWIRTARPELKIIVTSGHSAVWPCPDTADAFIAKPYDPARVAQRIKELLASLDT